jgi:hypothetical protein
MMMEPYQTSGLEGKLKIADETARPRREPLTQERRQGELDLPVDHRGGGGRRCPWSETWALFSGPQLGQRKK